MSKDGTIRLETEELERRTLHARAALSAKSRGRARQEMPDSVRTCYQRDRDRIIHSKAFRRLKHKTQVFLAPQGDHYRTRLTHVLEVSQIARTLARALRLNEDLTEAIALGHDLGHTPFGHAGEAVLSEIHPGGFSHYRQSLRVVDFLERDGRGLNLSWEVRNGILKHSKGKGVILPDRPDMKENAATLEGRLIRISDIIAYLNHDLDDALRAEVIRFSDIPADVVRLLGKTHSSRIDTMVRDVIEHTRAIDNADIRMGPNVLKITYALRDFLFRRVYEDEFTKKEFAKAKKILSDLYAYYLEHPSEAFSALKPSMPSDTHKIVRDFVAGMTDRFALSTYERIFLPRQWNVY